MGALGNSAGARSSPALTLYGFEPLCVALVLLTSEVPLALWPGAAPHSSDESGARARALTNLRFCGGESGSIRSPMPCTTT